MLVEERRLKEFENSLLRRIFGPMKYEVTGEWRKLRNDDLSDLHTLHNTVRLVKSSKLCRVWHVARMWESRGVQSVLVGKTQGKRPLERSRRSWEDYIKTDHQELRGGFAD